MFKEQSFFAILESNDAEMQIFKIEMTKEAQADVCNFLGAGATQLAANKESVRFNGCYKPDIHEVLVIEKFNFDQKILEAIKDPLGVAGFVPDKKKPPRIKATFMGEFEVKENKEQYIIAFQRFRKDQYITQKGINIFHDSDTFVHEKRFGICITDTVDCIIHNNQLKFSSFYYARQIFELSEYYREATDADVDAFISNDKICIENPNIFKDNADAVVRRKIALISDSGIFTKYTVKQITKKANQFGLKIPVVNDKIVFPTDKRDLKNVLKFLDDEIYKGVFSEEILQTNSKRKAEF